MTESTQEAPYGYKEDGTPYKRNPAAYANRRKSEPKAPGKTGSKNADARTQARAQAIFETLTIPTAALAIAGETTGNKALVADAQTLSTGSPKIAIAVAQVADQDPRVASIVDKLVQTGPYAALFTAVLPVAVQIAANHNDALAKAMAPMGAKTKDQVLEEAYKAAEAQQEAV